MVHTTFSIMGETFPVEHAAGLLVSRTRLPARCSSAYSTETGWQPRSTSPVTEKHLWYKEFLAYDVQTAYDRGYERPAA